MGCVNVEATVAEDEEEEHEEHEEQEQQEQESVGVFST